MVLLSVLSGVYQHRDVLLYLQESLKSLLPLMEPSITASLDLFAPFGSGPASGKGQLKGSFGNAVLDNIPDYYSQLLAKVWCDVSFIMQLLCKGLVNKDLCK